jgi:6-pyruvoyl-tetrahydropterin synthase-like protein
MPDLFWREPIDADPTVKWLRFAAPTGLVMLALAATAGFWNELQLYGHSAELDFFRQLSFDRCFQSGILWPRWLPDTYFGYGSPLFHFYGPMPYWLSEIFIVAGAPIIQAHKIVLVLTLIISGLGMYLFCRDWVGPLGSFLAGLAYMLAPYHLVDMVVRHAFGEHVAFAWLPWALWGVSGMATGRRGLRMLVAALALTATILTHNITAMLSAGALGLWWLVLATRSRDRKAMAWGAVAIIAGLCLAAFFWVPVMIEKDLTYAEKSLTSEYFVYWDHFVYPQQLFDPTWGFGGSRKGIADDSMSFQVGLVHWAFVVFGLAFLFLRNLREHRARPLVMFSLLLFAGSVFFMMPISAFVYRLIPILAYVQFPWRFLVFVALASSAAAVAIEPLTERFRSPMAPPLITGIAGCVLVLAYAAYMQPGFQIYDVTDDRFPKRTAAKIREMAEKPEYMHIWEVGGIRYLRDTGDPGTSRDDYLPKTVKVKPRTVPEKEVFWTGEGPAEVLWKHDGPVDLFATVNAEQPGTVEFTRFDFPGWAVFLDGDRVEHETTPGAGTISVAVPSGKSRVELRFGSTPLRFGTGLFSVLILLVLAAYAVVTRKNIQGRISDN